MAPINAVPSKDESQARKQTSKPTTQNASPIPSPLVQRDSMDISRLNPGQVLSLQRSIGNQAVQRLVASSRNAPVIQAKLQVGPAGDKYEQEADRIAAQVMKSPATSQPAAQREAEPDAIQRDHGEEEEEFSE